MLGANVWRVLQEGVATYAMLELAPRKIAEDGVFTQSEIELTKQRIPLIAYGDGIESFSDPLPIPRSLIEHSNHCLSLSTSYESKELSATATHPVKDALVTCT